ncbi:MAG: hypothetical protein HKN26_06685 [Acidimicrobiales bacterium]|nr:hypothetical protein [Acidimicrobiales bacterium]
MREAKPELDELGAVVIGVAAREDYQAQKLLDDGMPFDLLLDPTNQVREVIGSAARFGWHRLLHPKGVIPYVKAMRAVKWNGLTMAEANQRPAVGVFDAEHRLAWRHVGAQLGDYPTVDRVLAELRSLGESPRAYSP